MLTLSSNSNLGFLFFCRGLPYQLDKKFKLLTLLGIKSIEQLLSDFRIGTNWAILRKFFIKTLPCNSKRFFQGLCCTFNKCSLTLTHGRVTFYFLSFSKSLKTLHQTLYPGKRKTCRSQFFLVLIFKSFAWFLWKLLLPLLLLVQFNQTSHDELANKLHPYILLLVCQQIVDLVTTFPFWI